MRGRPGSGGGRSFRDTAITNDAHEPNAEFHKAVLASTARLLPRPPDQATPGWIPLRVVAANEINRLLRLESRCTFLMDQKFAFWRQKLDS
jgi:hypothetical protein